MYTCLLINLVLFKYGTVNPAKSKFGQLRAKQKVKAMQAAVVSRQNLRMPEQDRLKRFTR